MNSRASGSNLCGRSVEGHGACHVFGRGSPGIDSLCEMSQCMAPERGDGRCTRVLKEPKSLCAADGV